MRYDGSPVGARWQGKSIDVTQVARETHQTAVMVEKGLGSIHLRGYRRGKVGKALAGDSVTPAVQAARPIGHIDRSVGNREENLEEYLRSRRKAILQSRIDPVYKC